MMSNDSMSLGKKKNIFFFQLIQFNCVQFDNVMKMCKTYFIVSDDQQNAMQRQGLTPTSSSIFSSLLKSNENLDSSQGKFLTVPGQKGSFSNSFGNCTTITTQKQTKKIFFFFFYFACKFFFIFILF